MSAAGTSFTEFYLVFFHLFGEIWVLLGIPFVLPSFTAFHLDLLGLYLFSLVSTEFYRVFFLFFWRNLGFTGYSLVLPSFTSFFSRFTGFLHIFTGLY